MRTWPFASFLRRTPLAALPLLLAVACGGDGGGTTPKKDAGDLPTEDAGPTPTALRVMNWNVENFFNDKIDSPDAMDEAGSTPTAAVYQAKLADLAAVLRDGQADVVVLQEVENEATLKDLAARPELGGKYTNVFLKPGNDPRGIDIGVLSTRPLTRVVTHAGEKFDGKTGTGYRYARDCVEAHVDVDGREVVFLGVHFRSQINSGSLDSDDKRYAEAKHTRDLANNLLAANPDLPLVVLGDFNDVPGSQTIDAIEKGPPPFTDAVRLLPAGDAWTVNYGTPRIYDDQWASPALGALRDPASVTVVHGKPVSDHAAVVVTYTLPPR